jgi:hypothetical protein
MVKKRARNERTAKDWAIEILGQEKNGLTLKVLANRMLESGYKTTSTNFSVAQYQALHNAKNKDETFECGCENGELGAEEVKDGAEGDY